MKTLFSSLVRWRDYEREIPNFNIRLVKDQIVLDITSNIIHEVGEKLRFADYIVSVCKMWCGELSNKNTLIALKNSLEDELRHLVGVCALTPAPEGGWLWDPSKLDLDDEIPLIRDVILHTDAVDEVECFDGAEDFSYVEED